MIDDSLTRSILTDDSGAHTEIRWTLDPLPRLELLPAAQLLALNHGDLLAYTLDLQQDLESVRVLLHESLGALVQARAASVGVEKRVRRLVDAHQADLETIRALSTQLRACEEREA